MRMIARIWHGWTRPEKADAYQRLVQEEVIPAIEARGIPGLLGIDLMRRDGPKEIEFKLTIWFDSFDAVRAYAGDAHELAQVSEREHQLLSRFRERARHYQVVARGGG
jgi:antibiotic biosynthesis monooxygenase (ABM) superfamily enzyme